MDRGANGFMVSSPDPHLFFLVLRRTEALAHELADYSELGFTSDSVRFGELVPLNVEARRLELPHLLANRLNGD
jgi:hypothetical protein